MSREIALGNYSYDGTWMEFKPAEGDDPAVELLIRPYPKSMEIVSVKDGSVNLSGTASLKKFDYCLQDWKGLDIKLNGEKQYCNSTAKKIIYDFDVEGIATFVMQKEMELAKAPGDTSKN